MTLAESLAEQELTAFVPSERDDTLAAAARDRAARTSAGLAKLFDERPELLGVHAPADLAAEAVRWCA